MKYIYLVLLLFSTLRADKSILWLYDNIWDNCYLGRIDSEIGEFYIVYNEHDGYNKRFKFLYKVVKRIRPPKSSRICKPD